MGFGIGSYATIWSTERVSESMTKCRISTSRKNKNTGNYETDFSGFVAFVGTACANKASRLIERDHNKITQCDVKSKYDEEKRSHTTTSTCLILKTRRARRNLPAIRKTSRSRLTRSKAIR